MSCAEDMILVMLCVPYTACTILLALSARFGHLRRQLRACVCGDEFYSLEQNWCFQAGWHGVLGIS